MNYFDNEINIKVDTIKTFQIILFMTIFLVIKPVKTSSSEIVQPERICGELTYAVCINDGAFLRSTPDIDDKEIKYIKWMTDFVIINRHEEYNRRSWLRVGKYLSFHESEAQGWMLENDLLIIDEANKKDGVYQKAIVVVHYDQSSQVKSGAIIRKAPLENADRAGQDLTLSNIYYIYDERVEHRTNKKFILLGNNSIIFDPTKPENTIVGWVDSNRLFFWNTREAAEYDKSTMGKRDQAKIYEHQSELISILLNKQTPDKIEALATESFEKKEVLSSDPRFPIIDKTELNNVEMWRIAFICDELPAPYTQERESVARLSRLPNVVDILFVLDGSDRIKYYKDSILDAVKIIQLSATNYWQEHFPNETKPILRFSFSIYNDYSEPDYFKRIPLDENNISKIEKFISSHNFSGGEDKPALFNGLSSSIKYSKQELKKSSFRAIFLIGDMGNMGVSNQPDKKGHTIDSIARQIRSEQFDFYAIHVANSSSKNEYKLNAYKNFERQSKEIIKRLQEGFSQYISLTDPKQVRYEIYNKIIETLDQRFQTIQILKDICRDRILIGKQISGTIFGKRAIDIMKRHGLDPKIFANRNVQPFAKGWITPFVPGTNIRKFKSVVLMKKYEVEILIAILGRLTKVSYKHVNRGWVQALKDVTGDTVNINRYPNNDVPAEIIRKHLGIPVKSEVLNMAFTEIGNIKAWKLIEEINAFKEKLFRLRAVLNEQMIEVKKDNIGNILFSPLGHKKYWFGARGNESVWLDIEVYLP